MKAFLLVLFSLLSLFTLNGCTGGGGESSQRIVATADSASTVEGAAVWIDVLDNDIGAGIQIANASRPQSGTVTILPEDKGVVYQPEAGVTGTLLFTYTISAPSAEPSTATVTVNIRAADTDAVVAANDIASTITNAPVLVDVLANDTGIGNQVTTVGTPSNGTASIEATGINYQPSRDFTGTDTFTYEVKDQHGVTAKAAVTIFIREKYFAPVAVDDLTTVREREVPEVFEIDVLNNDSDPDGDPLSIVDVTLASNGAVVFDSISSIGYLPAPGFSGTDSFEYTISDGLGGISSAIVTITITANTPPVAVNDAFTAATAASKAHNVTFNDSDADGDELTIESVTQPTNGTVTIISATTVSYISNAGFSGTDTFAYTVSDGYGGTDSATVTVTVGSGNDTPVAVDDNIAVLGDQFVLIPVLRNDYDPDGDDLTIVTTTQPTNGTVVRNLYTVSYTANSGFIGIDTFTYTISDADGAMDVATVTVNVKETNTPPVAVDDAATTTEGTPVLIDVLANDSDADGDPLFVQNIIGTNASLEVNGLMYTPPAGFTGTDTFTYQAFDGTVRSDTATVTVTVTSGTVNTPPVAVDDAASTTEGTSILIDVLANDSDADGDPLVVQNIIGANASLEANRVRYTPPAGFTGTDTFTYQAFDGTVKSNTATVTVTVNPSTAIVARVSVDSSGNEATGSGFFLTGSPAVSYDGVLVAFRSAASNLVADDTNGLEDVFLHYFVLGHTTLVSEGESVPQANGASRDVAISASGQYVVFRSAANNLMTTVDSNIDEDIFLHDTGGSTSRVSVDSAGNQSNGPSYYPDISESGSLVVYYSAASNLVSADSNGVMDVFLHSRMSDETTRVSVASDGTEANDNSLYPAISAGGRYVAFESTATNLVTGDTNGKSDIFVHDTQTGTTTRVSVDSSGTESNNPSRYAAISADGRYVAFESSASNLVSGDTNSASDIFVRDTIDNTTTRISVASDGTQSNLVENSNYPAISDDGRYVAFYSYASNLVTGDTNGVSDVFVHDKQTGDTIRVSVDEAGTQANGASVFPEISGDGRIVVFYSAADNLVSGDTNGIDDAFRVDFTRLP